MTRRTVEFTGAKAYTYPTPNKLFLFHLLSAARSLDRTEKRDSREAFPHFWSTCIPKMETEQACSSRDLCALLTAIFCEKDYQAKSRHEIVGENAW